MGPRRRTGWPAREWNDALGRTAALVLPRLAAAGRRRGFAGDRAPAGFHSHRLCDRRRDRGAQCRRLGDPGVAHQDDDALSDLPCGHRRPAGLVLADQGLRPGRRDAADQARPARRRHHPGRGRDHGAGHPLRQRCRHGTGRGAGRQRGPVRHGDDPDRAQARHDPHRVPQRLGPAGWRAAYDGARSCSAGLATDRRLSGLLSILLEPELLLPRAQPSQPQPAAGRL